MYARIELTAEELTRPPAKSFAQIAVDEYTKAYVASELLINYPPYINDLTLWGETINAVLTRMGRADLVEPL